MITERWPSKDPDEFVDYSFDWGEKHLAPFNDTISTSTWDLSLGVIDSDELLPIDSDDTIAIEDDEFDAAKTTIWVRGGVLGNKYVFTNRVETEGGRTMVRRAKLFVELL